jgi:hypothetical protein
MSYMRAEVLAAVSLKKTLLRRDETYYYNVTSFSTASVV